MFSQGKIELNGHGNPNQGLTQDNTKVAHRRNDQKNKENFSEKFNETRG